MREQILKTILLITCIMVIPAHSFAGGHYSNGDVHVEIIADHRGAIAQLDGSTHEVIERSYIVGQRDEGYRIRVVNPTDNWVGVVIAVEGRNILSGNRSTLSSHEQMCILGPHQSRVYDGWENGPHRKNRFYFMDKHDSYAAHVGNFSAEGVVAVAVFNKKRGDFRRHGHGRGDWHPAHAPHFIAQKRAVKKIFIQYEWPDTLCRMGILRCEPKKRHHGLTAYHHGPRHRPHKRHARFELPSFSLQFVIP